MAYHADTAPRPAPPEGYAGKGVEHCKRRVSTTDRTGMWGALPCRPAPFPAKAQLNDSS
jgi:hypothetical protein